MPSDPLFDLVRSLTPEEKRAFKLQSKKYGREKGNNYLRLFDIFDGMAEYDEKKLKQQLEKTKLISQYHVTKAYLLDMLLDVLARKFENDDFYYDLQRQLSRANVLYSKGLYDAALKRTRKIMQRCDEHERSVQALQAAQLMEKIVVKLNAQELFEEQLATGIARQETALQRQEIYLRYRELSLRLMHFVNTNAAATQPLKGDRQLSAIGKAIRAEPPAEASVDTRILRLGTLSIYDLYFGDSKAALHHSLEALELGLRSDLEKLTAGVNSIINLFNNAAMLLAQQGDETQIDELVKKVLRYPTRDSDRIVMEERVNLVLITQNNALGRFEKTEPMLEGLEQFLDQHERTLSHFGKTLLYYNLMMHFFYTGKFRPALKWLNRLVTYDFSAMGKHILENVLLIELLLDLELKKNELFESRLKTNAKLMRKHNTFSELEEVFLEHFSQLYEASETGRMEQIGRLHSSLLELRKNPRLAYRFSDFAYDRWAESYLAKTTIAALLKQKQ